MCLGGYHEYEYIFFDFCLTKKKKSKNGYEKKSYNVSSFAWYKNFVQPSHLSKLSKPQLKNYFRILKKSLKTKQIEKRTIKTQH